MGKAFLVRPVPFYSITADGSAAGTTPMHLANDYMGVVHRHAPGPSGWVQVDLAAIPPINFAAFLSTNYGAGAQLQRVRADDDPDMGADLLYDSGDIPFAVPAGDELPGSGRGNSWWDESAAGFIQARYWRFDLTDPGGAYFEAGRLVMGRRLQFGTNFSFGGARGARDTGSVAFSATGNLLRRYGRRLRTVTITFKATTRDEVEQGVLPLFEGIGNTDPVFVCTDDEASPRRQARSYFGFLLGDLSAIQQWSDGFEWRCQMISLI